MHQCEWIVDPIKLELLRDLMKLCDPFKLFKSYPLPVCVCVCVYLAPLIQVTIGKNSRGNNLNLMESRQAASQSASHTDEFLYSYIASTTVCSDIVLTTGSVFDESVETLPCVMLQKTKMLTCHNQHASWLKAAINLNVEGKASRMLHVPSLESRL